MRKSEPEEKVQTAEDSRSSDRIAVLTVFVRSPVGAVSSTILVQGQMRFQTMYASQKAVHLESMGFKLTPGV